VKRLGLEPSSVDLLAGRGFQPKGYFSGKAIRVTGQVVAEEGPAGAKTRYYMVVESLGQLEVVK
ncbi:MAG TPA: hypothetical protein VFE78_23385, partial [Gemmataceae bacterium]|nr:hypothetical protein [Gemmataceae bacterium]